MLWFSLLVANISWTNTNTFSHHHKPIATTNTTTDKPPPHSASCLTVNSVSAPVGGWKNTTGASCNQ